MTKKIQKIDFSKRFFLEQDLKFFYTLILAFVENKRKSRNLSFFDTQFTGFYLGLSKLSLPDDSEISVFNSKSRDLMFAISGLYCMCTGKPCSFNLRLLHEF